MSHAGPGAGPVAVRVDTPDGPAEMARYPAVGRSALATVVLGHGAGRGPDTDDLGALAAHLPGSGIDVVLVSSPWVVAGRRVASPPSRLDVAWLAVIDDLRRRGWQRGPLVVGGRSAGARVAARTAGAVGADALLLLAFPLHPPGRPTVDRLPELLGGSVDRPVVVVQGERDAFGTPAQLRAALAAAAGTIGVVAVPAADHGLRHRPSSPITVGEWQALLLTAAVRAVAAASSPARREPAAG